LEVFFGETPEAYAPLFNCIAPTKNLFAPMARSAKQPEWQVVYFP
jgi:hypothetical protein